MTNDLEYMRKTQVNKEQVMAVGTSKYLDDSDIEEIPNYAKS